MKSIACYLFLPILNCIAMAFTVHAADMYVSVFKNNDSYARAIAPNGSDLGRFVSTGIQPFQGIAFNNSGAMFVDYESSGGPLDNTIHEFGPTGADLGTFVSTGMNDPTGLALDSSGNVYVANFGDSTIHEFGANGSDLGTFASAGVSNPLDLIFDSHGNLFVANRGGETIHEFGPTGANLGTFASLGEFPSGLAFDSSGNLYVSTESNNIHKFGPTGIDLGTFATFSNGLDDPIGLAFDTKGNLFASTIFIGRLDRCFIALLICPRELSKKLPIPSSGALSRSAPAHSLNRPAGPCSRHWSVPALSRQCRSRSQLPVRQHCQEYC